MVFLSPQWRTKWRKVRKGGSDGKIKNAWWYSNRSTMEITFHYGQGFDGIRGVFEGAE